MLEPGHRAERVDVGGAEDVADLAERGAAALGAGLDAEQRAERVGVLGREQQQHDAVEVADDGDHDGGDLGSGVAGGLDGLGERQRAGASGTEMSTGRPSMLDSAVPAVPEPMLASSRSASSCRSVVLRWVISEAGASLRRRRGEGVAVDDQGDVAVGQHGAAGERPRGRATSAGSGRVTSSRWPTRRVDARAPARCSRPRTMTAWSASGAAAVAEARRRRRAAAGRRRAGRASACRRRSGRCGRRGAGCARRGRAGSRTAGRRPRRAARP